MPPFLYLFIRTLNQISCCTPLSTVSSLIWMPSRCPSYAKYGLDTEPKIMTVKRYATILPFYKIIKPDKPLHASLYSIQLDLNAFSMSQLRKIWPFSFSSISQGWVIAIKVQSSQQLSNEKCVSIWSCRAVVYNMHTRGFCVLSNNFMMWHIVNYFSIWLFWSLHKDPFHNYFLYILVIFLQFLQCFQSSDCDVQSSQTTQISDHPASATPKPWDLKK